MFTFRPATEAQVKATKNLFIGYDEYRHHKYPIHIQDDRHQAFVAAINHHSPLSFLEEDSEYPKSASYRTITFENMEVRFGPATDSRYVDIDVVKFWFNRDVFLEYMDYLKIQINLADQFLREHE